jgi:hypothetical protein
MRTHIPIIDMRFVQKFGRVEDNAYKKSLEKISIMLAA